MPRGCLRRAVLQLFANLGLFAARELRGAERLLFVQLRLPAAVLRCVHGQHRCRDACDRSWWVRGAVLRRSVFVRMPCAEFS